MEPNHHLAIEEIYIGAKEPKDDYLCEDFIVYPEGPEVAGGHLLGIIELRGTPRAHGEKIIQAIINTLKDYYYEQISTSPDPQKLNLETVFEYALQKTNATIIEMIQFGHLQIMFENLHYVLAVAKPNPTVKDIDFFFTQQGLLAIYLLHKTKNNNYKVINVLENTPKLKDSEHDQLKIFSSTISGKIFYHDTLYLCSENFNNYIPAPKVNKIIAGSDLATAIDYFKNLINNIHTNSALTHCAIFIRTEEKRQASDQPLSQKSINNLISTKEKTEKYLTPALTINIFEYLRKALKLLQRTTDSKGKLRAPAAVEKKLLVQKICRTIYNVGRTIIKYGYRLGQRQNVIEQKNEAPDKKSARPRRRLIIVLGSVAILLLLLGASIFWIKYEQKQKIAEERYASQLKEIKDLINNAQINLIYKNEKESLLLVKQADNLMQNLPRKNNNQQANYNELQRQNNTIKNKLLHIEKLVPQLVTEVLTEGVAVNLNTIKKLDERLLFAGKGNAIFIYQLSSKEQSTLYSTYGDIKFSLQDEKVLLYLTNQNKLIKPDFEKKELAPQTINWGGGQIHDALLYNNNLYTLDANQQQIYKYRLSQNQFGEQQTWLKDKGTVDLTAASSFTIDGNIWVATTPGQLYKFYTGKIENFTLAPIEPALTNVKKVFTAANLDHLYLLEKNSKRIIVFNKNGDFIQQYLLETLDNFIADFIVENSILYFLVDNKVYQAPLK